MRLPIFLLVCLVALVLVAAAWQRKLLYFPTHHDLANGLSEWRHGGRLIGFSRTVPNPETVWLMLHGNAGQASDRAYALSSFSPGDSVFILEYPGYGRRPGTPSQRSLNEAAREGYQALRSRFPGTPVAVAGESLGSGPASLLSREVPAPDKIVLIAPFDKLHRVAKHHYPFLPVRLIMADDWDNAEALREYRGRLEIIGIRDDAVIPIRFARALAEGKPLARFRVIEGGHNDWATPGRLSITNP